MQRQKTQNGKHNVEGLILPDIKTYHKSKVIKTVELAKNRQIHLWNRREPRNILCLTFDKWADDKMQKRQSLQQMVWDQIFTCKNSLSKQTLHSSILIKNGQTQI